MSERRESREERGREVAQGRTIRPLCGMCSVLLSLTSLEEHEVGTKVWGEITSLWGRRYAKSNVRMGQKGEGVCALRKTPSRRSIVVWEREQNNHSTHCT